MTEMLRHDVELAGCTPEPLMAYLKALGILRLVSEQKDDGARGWWEDDLFHIGSTLDRDALVRFFLKEYKPTPIVAPWGARSGFFAASSEGTARQALENILNSELIRLEEFQHSIRLVREVLKEMRLDQKAKDEEKLALLKVCRNRLPDHVLSWLDACYVLTSDDRKFPPLLGTGGNEGSGSYVSGFAQQIVKCLVEHSQDRGVETALFGVVSPAILSDQTPGHFSPTAAGGANAGQGFDRPSATNAWDYILCLEGACAWSSAAMRRFGQHGKSMAAFPFTADVTGAGSQGIASKDQSKPKTAKRNVAELWLPIWSRPASFVEVQSLIAEGRATVGGRSAETGLDFARAVSSLGVDRGISAFQRTMFLMRNGQSFLNVSLGQFEVHEQRQSDLLNQVDFWFRALRRAVVDKKAPPRFTSALHRIDSAIFDFCKYGGAIFFQEILVALGAAERELSNAEQFRKKHKLRPLSGLSPDWAEAADDGSSEFAVARALASVYDPEGKIGPLRANLEAVDWKKKCRAWAEADQAAVWNAADLATNLANILQRRIMDGERAGCKRLPIDSRMGVPLSSVSSFLAGELDDRRTADLLWGLVLVDDGVYGRQSSQATTAVSLPRDYALLKLLFLPRPVVIEGTDTGRMYARLLRHGEEGGIILRPEPSILPLLRSGQLGEACAVAMRRLRASGLAPMPTAVRGYHVRDDDWRELDRIGASTLDPRRLAASLLIPIRDGEIDALARLVTRTDGAQNS